MHTWFHESRDGMLGGAECDGTPAVFPHGRAQSLPADHHLLVLSSVLCDESCMCLPKRSRPAARKLAPPIAW